MGSKLRIKAIVLFLLGCLCLNFAQSQDPVVDSLQQLLKEVKEYPKKVDLLNDLAWEYKIDRPDEARRLLEQSILLAQNSHYPKGEAQAYNYFGVVETIAENLEAAEGYYTQALSIRQQIGDKAGVASLYNNIGNLRGELGDQAGALSNLEKSLALRVELQDTIRIARVNYNLAVLQESIGNYDKALDHVLIHLAISEALEDEYEIATAHNLIGNIKSELERYEEALGHHQKALQLRKKSGDQWEMAIAYNNLGNSLDDLAEMEMDSARYVKADTLFAAALRQYEASLPIYQDLEDQEGISQVYNNIGLVYKNRGTFYQKTGQADSSRWSLAEARRWLEKSLALHHQMNNRKGIMEVYNGIGDVKRREGKWQETLRYTQQYLAIAEELGDEKFRQKAYKDLSRAYAGMGKYKEAFEYRRQYDNLRYQRLNEERARNNSQREALYGDTRKQHAIEQQEKELQIQQAELQRATTQRRALVGGVFALFLLAGLLYNRYRLKTQANQALADKNAIIERERQRSEELLLNILPAATAEELKATGKTQARHYPSATVLFTDFKSFTTLAEQMSPEQLVAELDRCFRGFDAITSKYGIEKIKTIGDAYMCAGGLTIQAKPHHASDVVAAALEIQAFMASYRQESIERGFPGFEARIGIHTGPVVAGVVGSKKFAYDIWGDTVNTAARMESSGEVGKVNISASTYALVNREYDCRARGKIEAKNKGAVEMYFVRGKKMAKAGSTP